MDAQEFLKRVVAPGAYYAIAFGPPEAKAPIRGHRFFRQADQLAEAAAWIRENARTHTVYHAVASFKTKSRRKEEAEALRCFWYDADIHRDGDGKAPEDVWADLIELARWLKSVEDRLPLPNLWISSGYGVHLYWILDEALPALEWLPYGQAFRDLLKALGARGDVGISADRARVLRPLETFNYKVPNDPRPVKDITPQKVRTQIPPSFVTKDFLAKLKTETVTSGVTSLGPRPNRPINQGMLAAAKANLSKPPPSDFALVASRCLQVKKSLEEGGEYDDRELWHKLVNLAYFCNNRQAAHDLGRKWIGRDGKGYSEEDTDAKFDQTEREHAEKNNFGAPTCVSLDGERRGVCDHCEFRGKVNSPYKLGYADAADLELPNGYRQQQSPTEGLYQQTGEEDEAWRLIVVGNVSNPQLYRYSDTDYELTFDYMLSGELTHVRAADGEIISVADRARIQWARKGITISAANAAKFSGFIVAWITKLREAQMWLDAPPAFGWVQSEGRYIGVAVGGTLYRTDGTEGVTQPGDRKIIDNYKPTGNINIWRKTCEYVVEDRPELQALVGASFGAPLMQLIGENGIVSTWSQLSGARKTSTFRVASAIWCHPIRGMPAVKDTANSVQHTLAQTKIMPVFWDEIHVSNKDQIGPMVDMFFNITQGRGKGRLDPKIEMRDVGHWYTLLMLNANKPNIELIEQSHQHTDAGAVRLFEYELKPPGGTADPEASSTVQLAQHNYGHAGREYLRWVIDNLAEVEKILKSINNRLYKDIPDIRSEERFHVASIVGIVAGALIASEKVGLVKLDVKGVYQFLKSKMQEVRSSRQEDSPSDPKTVLINSFEKFVSDNKNILATQNFSKPGRPKGGRADLPIRSVGREPPYGERAYIHIGLDERELRFDYNVFKDWCRRNGQTPTVLLGLMISMWNAQRTRAVLAIGTQWTSSGNVPYVRVILDRPELEHHLAHGTPAPVSNVVPFPAAE